MKLVLLLCIATRIVADERALPPRTAGQSLLSTRGENTSGNPHPTSRLWQETAGSRIVRRTAGRKGNPKAETQSPKGTGWETFSPPSSSNSGNSGRSTGRSLAKGSGQPSEGNHGKRPTSGGPPESNRMTDIGGSPTIPRGAQENEQRNQLPGPALARPGSQTSHDQLPASNKLWKPQAKRPPARPAGSLSANFGQEPVIAPSFGIPVLPPRPSSKKSSFLAKTAHPGHQASLNPLLLSGGTGANRVAKIQQQPLSRNDLSITAPSSGLLPVLTGKDSRPSRKRGQEAFGSSPSTESRPAAQKRPKVAKGGNPTERTAQDSDQQALHGARMLLAASMAARPNKVPSSQRSEGRDSAAPSRLQIPSQRSNAANQQHAMQRAGTRPQSEAIHPVSPGRRPRRAASLAPTDSRYMDEQWLRNEWGFQPGGDIVPTANRRQTLPERPEARTQQAASQVLNLSQRPEAAGPRAVGNQPNHPAGPSRNSEPSFAQRAYLQQQLQLHQAKLYHQHQISQLLSMGGQPNPSQPWHSAVERSGPQRPGRQQWERVAARATPPSNQPGPSQPLGAAAAQTAGLPVAQPDDTTAAPQTSHRSQRATIEDPAHAPVAQPDHPAGQPPNPYGPQRIVSGQPRFSSSLREWTRSWRL